MRESKFFSTTTLLVIVAIGLALFLPLTAAVMASASPTINKYTIPTPDSMPAGITAGPDGNLWFAEWGGHKIAKITTSGSITEYGVTSTSQCPTGITSGPDGNIWFAEDPDNKIAKMTTSGSVTEYAVPTFSSGPFGIAAGPDRNMWFTEGNYYASKIGKVTPSGTFTEYPIPTANSIPDCITSGPDGNMWFTEWGANKIGKITRAGSVKEYSIPTSISQPKGITKGPDGNIWFTEWGADKIGKISPSGSVTEYSLPTDRQPSGITEGPDGNLWFTEYQGFKIGRITTTGSVTEFSLPKSTGFLEGITTGPDGNIWFTDNSGNKIGVCILGPGPKSGTTYYFAEGTCRPNFDPYFCIQNPGNKDAKVTLTYMKGDGTTDSDKVTVAKNSRATISPKNKLGVGDDVAHDFSTTVSSDQQIIAERPMYFNYQGVWTGGHDVLGATSSETAFGFAEGTCRPGFDTYFCIQNPGSATADVSLIYLKGDGSEPVEQKITIPVHSRSTVKAKDILGEANDNADDFSTVVECTNSQQIIAERPMYFNYNGVWTGGSDVVGNPYVAKNFYFAEGTCRPGFDPYFCVQNPGSSPAKVTLTYMKGDGTTASDQMTVDPRSRSTVIPRKMLGTGDDAAHDFSTEVKSDQYIIAERPMYFNYEGGHNLNWNGGHDVMGALTPAPGFAFAEGTCRPGFDTYFCIQNPGSTAAKVTITYMKGDGTNATDKVTVPKNSRYTVIPRNTLGTGDDAAHDFSTLVYSTNKTEIIAERPMYFNYCDGGDYNWTGGSDVVGSPGEMVASGGKGLKRPLFSEFGPSSIQGRTCEPLINLPSPRKP